MARRTLSLTEEQRQELLRLRDHDARPYVRERGVYDDLPLAAILTELRNTYGSMVEASPRAIDDAFTAKPTTDEQPAWQPQGGEAA